ncbi:MAG: hypothetical protein PHU95_05340 [Candidatus Thermoplasmatota archaeon]|nr:hypothetical protein [Candidatus Thermoplasmatota archaeon]
MPGRDGGGPPGGGGRGGRGRGLGGGWAQGAGGICRCPNCGYQTEHQLGMPCYSHKCPQCGTPLTRV